MPCPTNKILDSPFVVNNRAKSASALPTIRVENVNSSHAHTPIPVNYAMVTTQSTNAHPLPSEHGRLEITTPVNWDKLNKELDGYDQDLRSYLVNGFKNGFSIGCVSTPNAPFPKNHSSALKHSNVIQDHIRKGLSLKRIAGPYATPPYSQFVSSPLGVVPKSEPGKFRVIHDLSYPKENSVNSYIPKEYSTVQYDTIDLIIQLVQKYGKNCLMAKTDIEDAFRIIPVNPADYHLLGFSWDNEFYFDKCLPMGASSSCQVFERLSVALQWVMQTKYKAGDMSHILDDFFFIGPADLPNCKNDLTHFLYLCKTIGVPIKMSKTQTPTKSIIIYGIEIDSTKMEARLPLGKVEKIRTHLLNMQSREQTNLRDLQSLIGLLNFACSVVVPGRAFLRRLIDLTCGVQNHDDLIDLTDETKSDIETWVSFLASFNGKSVFLSQKWFSSDHITLYTDASGSLGFAAIFGSNWFVSHWRENMENYQIAIKELFPIVLAIEIWGEEMKNKKVLFMSDNLAVVQVINKQTSKEVTLMKLVRRLVLATLKWNIHFRAKHIPGKYNIAADKLSRFQFQAAFQYMPQLEPNPTLIPEPLLEL